MGNLSSKKGPSGEVLNTTPTGLYDHCEWDPKVVRRLILERKLAPIYLGKEEANEEGLEECPICFLYYSGGLNRSRCCRKGACTECYLQVKRPNQNTTCPFCNNSQYIVSFTGPLSKEEIAQDAQEQLKVLELKINMRKEEIERDKQREMERERLRKEREQNPSSNPPTPPIPSGPPSLSRPVDTLRTQSAPSNTNPPLNPPPSTSPFGSYGTYGASYPPSSSFLLMGESPSTEPDLDELMLMEAIRLSLLDVHASLRDDPPSSSSSSSSPPTTTTTTTSTLTTPASLSSPPPPPDSTASSSTARKDDIGLTEGDMEGDHTPTYPRTPSPASPTTTTTSTTTTHTTSLSSLFDQSWDPLPNDTITTTTTSSSSSLPPFPPELDSHNTDHDLSNKPNDNNNDNNDYYSDNIEPFDNEKDDATHADST